MNWKAYPPTWADHAALCQAAGRWQRRGLLAASQQAAIEAAYPLAYYRPGFWLRLGLFVATWLAIGSVAGAGVLVFGLERAGRAGVVAYCLLVAAGCAAVLEYSIRTARHYRAGTDNALLYGALGAWQLAWLVLADALPGPGDALPKVWLALAPSLLAQGLALVRYADPVVAATTAGTALGLLLATLAAGLGGWLWLLLPMVLLLSAGALLLVLRHLPGRPDYYYYRSAGLVLRTLALAAIHLAGNYWLLLNLLAEQPDAHPAPGWMLATGWVLSLLVPPLYLALALRRHDRLLLWLGLLALAGTVYTLRQHYHVLPPAVAATLGGVLLTALVLAALRYLRRPRHGLTTLADADAAPPINLESFVTLETAHLPAAPAAPSFGFGGGQSGGGGAGGQW